MRLERVVFLGSLIAAASGTAWASDLPEEGLLGLMAPPQMSAGGEKHTLRLVALTADGAPMTGLKVKVSPSSGTAGSVRMVEPGLYTFTYTTPNEASEEVVFDVAGRTSDRAAIDWTQTVRVDPKATGSLTLTAEPKVSVLSAGASATLTVEGVSAGEALDLRATAGTLKTQVPLGDGRVKVRYELPEVNYPHVVLMSASSGDASNPAHGALALPLSAKVEYPLQDSPGATLMLKVGDREFGPVEADQDGFAALPIEVPAGQENATLIRVVDGVREEQNLPLGLTEVPRVMLFPQPDSIPGGQAHEIKVFAVEKNGEPASDASVLVLASAGEMGAIKSYGDGIYGAVWTAPPEGAEQVTFSAVLEGVSAPADTLQISVPTGLSGAEVALQANGSGSAWTASAQLAGATPVDLVAYGAMRKGDTLDRGEGKLEATFALDSELPGYVRALPMLEASTNTVEGVLVYPMADRVSPDGISDLMVHAVAVDAFGFPVRDANLALSVSQGDGSVPAEVVTDEHGIATFSYRAGSEASMVHLLATSAGVAGAASVMQVPASAQVPSLSLDRHPAWDGLMARAMYRSGEAPAPVAEEAPAEEVAAVVEAPEEPSYPLGQAGDTVVRLDLRSIPEKPVPGDSFVLRIYGLSSAKDRVPGLSFEVMSSAGEMTALAEVDPGVYEAVIELPRRQTDPVKVSVVGGGTMDFKSVEMGTRAPKEKAEKAPRPPVSDSSSSIASFRLSGAATLYSYEQQPSADSGPLLDKPLAVTGANRAVPLGGAIEAMAWMPGVEVVGVRARGRMTRYGIAASIFEGQALDWLVDSSLDVMGRYTLPLSFGSVWAGGHVGFRYDDFMIFTGCLDDGCTVGFEPLTVPGLGLGLDLGVDLGQAVVSAEYTQGFARFQVPYASSFEVRGAYRLDQNWSVDVGLVSIARSVKLEGADSGLERGTLDDAQLIMELGVGFRL